MNFRNASPFLIPILFFIVLFGLVALKNTTQKAVTSGYDLKPEDVWNSQLAPIPNDKEHLTLTIHLAPSGEMLIKALQQSHPGQSSAHLLCQGTSVGDISLSPQMNLSTIQLTLPTKDAIAARMAIGK